MAVNVILICLILWNDVYSSTLSSGINAMAANTIEDVLVNYLKNTSQWAQTLVAKLIGKCILLC